MLSYKLLGFFFKVLERFKVSHIILIRVSEIGKKDTLNKSLQKICQIFAGDVRNM